MRHSVQCCCSRVVLCALVGRCCNTGFMAPALDTVLRGINNEMLPATQEAFAALFAKVFGDCATYGLANPWTHGRASGSDDGLRVRARFKWRARAISLPGLYVRDQQPPSQEQTLLVSARDAWENPYIRYDCENPRVVADGDGNVEGRRGPQLPVPPPASQGAYTQRTSTATCYALMVPHP